MTTLSTYNHVLGSLLKIEIIIHIKDKMRYGKPGKSKSWFFIYRNKSIIQYKLYYTNGCTLAESKDHSLDN